MTKHLSITAGLVSAALLVAACGGGGYSGGTPAKANPTGLQLKTVSGTDGTYLTDASGRALYLWVADRSGRSVCTGACAQAWPPLTAKRSPSAGGGVRPGDLATVPRSGGGQQVTYQGHPLYYYAGDSGPGTTTGQGSDEFGAKWWLVAPSGAAITG